MQDNWLAIERKDQMESQNLLYPKSKYYFQMDLRLKSEKQKDNIFSNIGKSNTSNQGRFLMEIKKWKV